MSNETSWLPSFDVKVLPGNDSDPMNFNLTWNMIYFNGTKMLFQMFFDSPEYISQFDDVEDLEITFRNNFLFVSETGQFIKEDFTIERAMPPMYNPETDELIKHFTKWGKIFKEASQYVFASNFVLHLLLAAALNQLWSMVHIQQILILLPMLQVRMPASCNFVFSILFQIAAFDFREPGEDFEEYFETAPSEPFN